MSRFPLVAAAVLLWSGSVWAEGPKVSGFVAVELRGFVDAPQFRGQFEGVQPSVILNPEFSYDTDDGRHQFSLVPFFRLDGQDDRRTHFDVREAYWRYIGDDWELLAGFNTVFWGVTESRHLVNVINQIDAVEDIDQEDFQGQPMVNLSTQRDWGWLSLYVLPGYRTRTFPGREGRLRTEPPVDEDASVFKGELVGGGVDVALRYSHAIGDWDMGTYYFYGIGREPRLLPNANGTSLVQQYDLINQVGLDLQHTSDAWLWKFEGILREGQADTFGATVAGFEYTFFQVYESDADLGVLAEYLYDGRDDFEAPPTIFQNDIFVGTRLALNDIQGTTGLVGVFVDTEDQSTVVFIEGERRIGENWKIELESRSFWNIDDANFLTFFRDDSFITLRLSWFF